MKFIGVILIIITWSWLNHMLTIEQAKSHGQLSGLWVAICIILTIFIGKVFLS